MKSIEIKKIFQITPEKQIVSFDVNPENEMTVLYKTDRGGLRILINQNEFDLPRDIDPCFVRWYDKNNILISSSRSVAGRENNGFFLNREGKIIKQLKFGDGILEIDIDSNGNIWVGYFDEGIFGDIPVSQEGLVCFSGEGKILFKFHSSHPDLPKISDCYMLNVDNKNRCIWLCYYTDFPLIQLDFSGKLLKRFPELPEALHGNTILCKAQKENLFYFFNYFQYKNSPSIIRYNNLSRDYEVLKVQDQNGRSKDMLGFGRANKLILYDQHNAWVKEF